MSERGAEAALGANGAALVRHHRALDRAEYRDVLAGLVVEAGTRHRADGAAAARRCKRKVLPDQHGVDGAVTYPLLRDHAAMQVGLQAVVAAEEGRHSGDVEFAALLEIYCRRLMQFCDTDLSEAWAEATDRLSAAGVC
jgi:hypothetical protein